MIKEFIPYYPEHLKNSPFITLLDPSFDGNALSLIDENGRCQAIFGLILTKDGVPMLGTMISPELRGSNSLSMNKWSKKAVAHMAEFFNLPFIEAEAHKNKRMDNRWLIFLGFELQRVKDNINTYRYTKR